jgi:hypothetical protein
MQSVLWSLPLLGRKGINSSNSLTPVLCSRSGLVAMKLPYWIALITFRLITSWCVDDVGCDGLGLCLHQIKGLWRTALVLSTLLPSDLDQISPAQRAHQFHTTEDAILKLGDDFIPDCFVVVKFKHMCISRIWGYHVVWLLADIYIQ